MFNILQNFTSLDMFVQQKQFNVSRDKSSYQSCIGSCFTLLVYLASFAFFILQADVLVNHKGTSINIVTIPEAITSKDVLTL